MSITFTVIERSMRCRVEVLPYKDLYCASLLRALTHICVTSYFQKTKVCFFVTVSTGSICLFAELWNVYVSSQIAIGSLMLLLLVNRMRKVRCGSLGYAFGVRGSTSVHLAMTEEIVNYQISLKCYVIFTSTIFQNAISKFTNFS